MALRLRCALVCLACAACAAEEDLGKALQKDISQISNQVAGALAKVPQPAPAPAPAPPPADPAPAPAPPPVLVLPPLPALTLPGGPPVPQPAPMPVPLPLPVLVPAPKSAALPATRQLSDDEVIASQRGFSIAWRDHFNQRNVEYCGGAYLEDASLHASLGPMAAKLHELLGLQDPTVLHGRSSIEHFWNQTMSIGLTDMQAYAGTGEFASTSLAVDDNTVVVAGKFAFGTTASGEILSETWVRTGGEWKLRSLLVKFQELSPKAHFSPVVLESSQGSDRTSGPLTLRGDSGGSQVKAGGSGPLLFLVVLATCGMAGVLLRRTRRKREAAIAGFEAMLG